MKIALCGRFNTDIKHQGGSAEVLLSLAEKLSERHIVSLFGRGKPTKDIVDMCNRNKIQLYYIPSDSYFNILLGPIRALILLKKTFSDFDIIHTHNGSYAFASIFFKGKSKIITHVHEMPILRESPLNVRVYLFLENSLVKFAARHSDLTVALNEYMRNIIVNIWKVKNSVVILPNGVDRKFFVKDKRRAENNTLRILYVGRLAVQKRVDRIIEALTLLAAPAYLTIVGDGENRQNLKKFAEHLQLNNISFEGEQSGEQLLNYYRGSDVFAISSDREGMPLSVLEAMAAGLAVVGSNVLGIQELVNNVGIPVDEPYPKNFAKAFAELAENPKRLEAFSKMSIEKAEQYSWEKIVKELEKIYETVCVNR